jgi:hypothetical protein
MSVTFYVLCKVSSSPPSVYTLHIYYIYSFPSGLGERRTALSVNAAPYEGRRRPASGVRPPDRVLRRGPGPSLLWTLGLRSLPGCTHRPGLQVAPTRQTGPCVVGQVCRPSRPEILLERPRDAPRFLPDSVYRPGSFLCAARCRRRSSPRLSDVTGGVSGGAHGMVIFL